MSATVRVLQDNEIEELAAVLLAAYAQYFPNEPLTEGQREAWGNYRADIADVAGRLAASEQLVAELDGQLVGGVTFFPPGKLELTTDTDGLTTPPGWAGVRLLGVHPDARGRGIGRQLTEACIERARSLDATDVALHTTELMRVARAMYERMGFTREPAYDFKPIPGSDFTVVAYRLPL